MHFVPYSTYPVSTNFTILGQDGVDVSVWVVGGTAKQNILFLWHVVACVAWHSGIKNMDKDFAFRIWLGRRQQRHITPPGRRTGGVAGMRL